MSKQQQWQRVSELFDAVLAMPAAQRSAYLQAQQGTESEEVLAEVQALILEADQIAEEDTAAELLRTGGAQQVQVFQPLQPDATLGNWRVLRLLGRGGMGEVYEVARTGDYQQHAALKLVFLNAAAAVVRFHAERMILAKLEHPGIARILDGGTTEDHRPYMVMELIQGQPIHQYCDAHGLKLEARLRLFLQVCAAVSHAHQKLVVHRDIKPSNILVTTAGDAKLLDFGIAKLLGEQVDEATRTQSVLTPIYASPEQLANQPISTASDVYSLGVVLFQLLAGRTPVDSGTSSIPKVIEQVLDGRAPLASRVAASHADAPVESGLLAGDLDAILERCLRRDAVARYGSVDALADDLRAFLEYRPVLARQGGRGYRAGRFLRRYAWQAAAVLLVTGTLIAGLITTQLAAARTQAALEREQQATQQAEAALQQARIASAAQLRRAADEESLRAAFARILGRAYEKVPGSAELLAFMQASQQEAIDALDERPADSAAVLLALAQVHVQSGRPNPVIDALTPLLDHAQIDERSRAHAHALIGSANIQLNRLEEGIPHLERAVTYFDQQPDGQIDGVLHFSLLASAKRDPALRKEAVRRLQAAIARERQKPNPRLRSLGFMLSEVGFNQYRLNELAAAEASTEQAIAAYRAASGPSAAQLVYVMHNLAAIQKRLGKDEAALDVRREAIALTETLQGRSLQLANAKRSLGVGLVNAGRTDEALQLFDDVDALIDEFGGRDTTLYFLNLNGRVRALAQQGRFDEAVALASRGIAEAEATLPGELATIGSGYYELANTYAQAAQPEKALTVLEQSDQVFSGLGELKAQAMARNNKLREQLTTSEAEKP